MRLRGRFTLWFALAALVPIAVAAVVTREVVTQSLTEEFESEREAAQSNLQRELTRLERSVTQSIGDMVDTQRKHPLVAGVLVDLDKGPLSPATRRRIKNDGRDYMRGLGLDVLFVTDTENEVLVAPHYRPAHDTTDEEHSRRARARKGRAFYARELTMPGDRIVPILAVESANEFRQGRHRIAVVGGREVEAELLGPVRKPGRVDARIIDDEGRLLVPPSPDDVAIWDESSAVRFTEPLLGPDGETTATIEVAISTAELERVLWQVTLFSLILAGAALLVTTLLGFFVAQRMTSNLDRLVEGAEAAARGDLDHRVEIKGRDEIGALAESFNAMMEELVTSKERLVIAERVAAWQEIARRLAHEIQKPPHADPDVGRDHAQDLAQKAPVVRRDLRRIDHHGPRGDRPPQAHRERVLRVRPIAQAGPQAARPQRSSGQLSGPVPGRRADRAQTGRGLAHGRRRSRPAVANPAQPARKCPPRRREPARRERGEGDGDTADETAGRIVVETRFSERGDRLEVVVEDSGPGLPDPVKEKLFTPYFTTKQGGTGLGLALVHRMISDHGGRIIAGDSDLGGARFVLQFPLGEALKETTIRLEPSRIPGNIVRSRAVTPPASKK